MRKCVCAVTLAAVVLGLAGSASAAVTANVGLRFDDGTVGPKDIIAEGPLTVELFIQTATAQSPNDVLAYYTASQKSGGAGDWIEGTGMPQQAGWDCGASNYSGSVDTWLTWCNGPAPAAATEHVIAKIDIAFTGNPADLALDPAVATWDLALGTPMVDVIVNLVGQPDANTAILAGFGKVTIVPEPATLSFLTLGSLLVIRRRR